MLYVIESEFVSKWNSFPVNESIDKKRTRSPHQIVLGRHLLPFSQPTSAACIVGEDRNSQCNRHLYDVLRQNIRRNPSTHK